MHATIQIRVAQMIQYLHLVCNVTRLALKPNALPSKKIADGGCNPPAVGLQLHWVTTAESAQLLGCSVRTIRYWEMQVQSALRPS